VDKPDEHHLLQVATAISDGVAVDWAHLTTPQAPSQATAVLREMAVLDRAKRPVPIAHGGRPILEILS